MQNLTAPALAEWLADKSRPAPVLLDVREPWEIQTASIAGAISIPMREIPARSEELDDDVQIVCVCHHGARVLIRGWVCCREPNQPDWQETLYLRATHAVAFFIP
jgi:rhodanese-related sulfurtransferase